MKQRDEKNFEYIKEQMDETKSCVPLPDELSRENMEKLLAKEDIIKIYKKPPYIKIFAAAAAAVFMLAAGISGAYAFLSHQFSKPVVSAESEPKTVESYSEIEQIFANLKAKQDKQTALRKISYSVDSIMNGGMKSADFTATGNAESISESAAGASGSSENTAFKDGGYGKTNTQVENVDEADIVKNDGRYIYSVRTFEPQKIVITDALPVSNMRVLSEIKADEKQRIEEIYIKDNLLIAIASDITMPAGAKIRGAEIMDSLAYRTTKSIVNIYDISDKTAPTLKKSFSQDGVKISTRMMGDMLYVISNYYVQLDENDYKDKIIPTVCVDDKVSQIEKSEICILPEVSTPEYLILSAINTSQLDKEPEKTALLGAGRNIYANLNAIYVYNSYDNKTEIYKFDINGGTVKYSAKGEVKGNALNQFSMDEHDAFFRIATTIRENDGKSSNSLYVLDKDMKQVGTLENIAPDEQIYSVRFMGKSAYMVTFRQVDPLFIIDLSDPATPKITGELKIPGFSNYLHPVSDTLLIGIGRDGTDSGANSNLKLSLFDVSDRSSPKEVDTYIIKDAYSSAEHEHRAVMYDSENKLIGLPVSTYSRGNNYYAQRYLFAVLKIENDKFILQGVFSNHDDADYNNFTDREYMPEVLRGTYIDTNLYTISHSKIKAFSIVSGAQLGSVAIDK